MPTPKPWSLSRWRMMSRTRKIVYSLVGFVVVATGIGYVVKFQSGLAPVTPAAATPAQAGNKATSNPPSVGPVVVVPEAPKPSARAAAIVAYNKLRSNCPQRADTLVTTKDIRYAIFVDDIKDQVKPPRMTIGYDVCGLSNGAMYKASFTLTKLNQSKIPGRGQKPFTETDSGRVAGPRSKKSFSMYTRDMSPGDYMLEVTVTAAPKRVATTSYQFKIKDK
jgi:hypothetical protein